MQQECLHCVTRLHRFNTPLSWNFLSSYWWDCIIEGMMHHINTCICISVIIIFHRIYYALRYFRSLVFTIHLLLISVLQNKTLIYCIPCACILLVIDVGVRRLAIKHYPSDKLTNGFCFTSN